MSELRVNTIKKADGTGSLSVPAESGTVVTTASPSLGRRNLIINGAMQVAQRGTSSTGVTSAGYYTVDRFKWLSTCDDVVTLNQSTDAPSGFANSFHVDVTTADTTVTGTADRAQILYAIEAQDLQHLDYGSASAKTMTLSFWVKSTVTGTYAVGFYAPDATRYYSSTYVVNTADTWEQKTLTITGDASGQIDNDNASGLTMYFFLTAEPNYTTGSGDTWSASSNEWAVGHNVNVLGSTANNFYLTGVQLEVGSVATPFEHRSFNDEYLACLRYCYSGEYLLDGNGIILSNTYGTGDSMIDLDYPVPMRVKPTITFTAGGGFALTTDYSSNFRLQYYDAGDTATFLDNFLAEAEL